MNRFMQRKRKGKVAFIFVAIIVGILLLIALIQFLWNNLVTDIFHLRSITYWEALGLFILSKLLFGSGPGKPRGFKRRFEQSSEREEIFTCEDRERLRDEWKRRFKGSCGDNNPSDSE